MLITVLEMVCLIVSLSVLLRRNDDRIIKFVTKIFKGIML